MKEILNKNIVFLILCVVIVFLIFTQIKSCQSNKEIARQYENTIAALNDSVHKTVNSKGDTVFVEKVAEMTPKDIMNSALYKTLDKKTQEYIKELSKTKGLLASVQFDIKTKDSIIENTKYNPSTTTITDSTIAFKKGSSVLFNHKTKNLDCNINLTFKDSLKWSVGYTYQTEITTTWTREKDKSIKIEYKLDDPKAEVVNGKAFYIPADGQKSKFRKTVETAVKIIVPTAAFVGGFYLGYKLAK